MPLTPRLGLYYPVLADNPDVPDDMRQLALSVEAASIGWIIGDFKFSFQPADHDQFILCDGNPRDRAPLPAPYLALIDSILGAHPDPTKVRTPDFRRRSPMGAHPGGSPINGVVPNLGALTGEEVHQLLAAESGVNAAGRTVNAGVHHHGIHIASFNSPDSPNWPGIINSDWSRQFDGFRNTGDDGDHFHNLIGRVADSAHNTVHPVLFGNWFIATGGGGTGTGGGGGTGATATTTTLGLVLLSTAPTEPDAPIVVTDTDPRLTDQRVPPDGTVTPAKLSFDPATQVELDAEATARTAADALKAPLASPAFTGSVGVPVFTLATRPVATIGAGKTVFISDAAPGAQLQTSNGTAWGSGFTASNLNALSASVPDKLAWEYPAGTDVVEWWGERIAAGALAAANVDNFNVDSSANFTQMGGGALVWDTANSRVKVTNNVSVEYQTNLWGPHSDTDAASVDVGFTSGGASNSVTAGCGFHKTAGTSAFVSGVYAFLIGNGTLRYYENGVSTDVVTGLSITRDGTIRYRVTVQRNGNNVVLSVYDTTTSTYLYNASRTIDPTRQAALGAGVSMAGITLHGQGDTGESTYWDTLTHYQSQAEQRDLYLAITPAGGARTVKRIYGFNGTSGRSDFVLSNDTRLTGVGAPVVETANYTLTLTDAGKAVEQNAAGATTVTVPPNSTAAFPVGTVIEVHRYGAGTVAIAAGAGVTIRSRGALLSISAQYGSVRVRKRATDEWVLTGDLA